MRKQKVEVLLPFPSRTVLATLYSMIHTRAISQTGHQLHFCKKIITRITWNILSTAVPNWNYPSTVPNVLVQWFPKAVTQPCKRVASFLLCPQLTTKQKAKIDDQAPAPQNPPVFVVTDRQHTKGTAAWEYHKQNHTDKYHNDWLFPNSFHFRFVYT